MKQISGIYQIKNVITNDIYIGSTINFTKRKYKHFSDLKNNISHSSYLQRAWNKYGKDNFEFEILLKCPCEYLIKLEQKIIDNLKPKYNARKIAHNNLGIIVSKETRDKISKLHKGRKRSPETCQKIKNALKGKKQPRERVERMIKTMTERYWSKSIKIERNYSTETRKSISEQGRLNMSIGKKRINYQPCEKAKINALLKISKKVICIETGVIYTSCREAERITGCYVRQNVKGKSKKTKGFTFKYYEK